MIFLGENTPNGSYFFIPLRTGGVKHGRWFVLQTPCEFSDTPVCIEVQKAAFEPFRTEQTDFPFTLPTLVMGLAGLCPF